MDQLKRCSKSKNYELAFLEPPKTTIKDQENRIKNSIDKVDDVEGLLWIYKIKIYTYVFHFCLPSSVFLGLPNWLITFQSLLPVFPENKSIRDKKKYILSTIPYLHWRHFWRQQHFDKYALLILGKQLATSFQLTYWNKSPCLLVYVCSEMVEEEGWFKYKQHFNIKWDVFHLINTVFLYV